MDGLLLDQAFFQVRPGSPNDVDSIVRLHFAAVHITASSAYPEAILNGWSPDAKDEKRKRRIRAAMAKGDEFFVVAVVDHLVRGFGSIVPSRGELRAVYVDPVCGSRGVGTAILLELEKVAREHGVSRLQMDASLNAESFYEKRGYSVIARGTHTLAGGLQMACVAMEKDLTLGG
jgi:putative acetyltransferase